MSNRFSRALPPRRSVAVLGALAASVVLAACGGSGNSTNSVASAEKTREQQFLKLAKCLREHGINVSTPTDGGGLKIRVQGGVGSITPQKAEAARSACSKYAPAENQNLTPQQRVEREEAVQKFAKCMREHGIKVEAKTNSRGEFAIGIHGGPGSGGPNPESPAFEAAQKACQSYLPIKRQGVGGPGGPGPTTNKSGGAGSGQKSGLAIGG